MKITVTQLRKIINEEVQKALNEVVASDGEMAEFIDGLAYDFWHDGFLPWGEVMQRGHSRRITAPDVMEFLDNLPPEYNNISNYVSYNRDGLVLKEPDFI